MDDFFRQNLGSLRGSEAKLLITVWALGTLPNPELMRISGVRDRKTFYDGLRRLREVGFLGEVGKTNSTSWKILPPGWESQPVQPEPRESWWGNPTSRLEKPTQGLDKPTSRLEKPTQGLENPTDDIQAAITLADEMDAEGDERNLHSPFQIRRKRQIELIQQAWSQLFNEDLNPLAAKQLLQTAHSQATDVYGAMVAAAERNVQYKQAYVKKMLEGNASKPAASVLHKNVYKSDGDGPGDLRPVTEEMRKSWDELGRKFKASGILDDWEL